MPNKPEPKINAMNRPVSRVIAKRMGAEGPKGKSKKTMPKRIGLAKPSVSPARRGEGSTNSSGEKGRYEYDKADKLDLLMSGTGEKYSKAEAARYMDMAYASKKKNSINQNLNLKRKGSIVSSKKKTSIKRKPKTR